jgi:DNA-directed RNA polymerase specialized sigma24 family protein
MPDYGKYITEADYPQGNGNIYHNDYPKLQSEWLSYYKVALWYAGKAISQDREDLLQDIIITLADVANGHNKLTEASMYRIASYKLADYWRKRYSISNGLDCGSCSRKQRQICRKGDLYTECPRAIKVTSLNKPIIDSDGNITELGELIADDKAIDLEAWIDARVFLLSYPKRLIDIAKKRIDGIALTRQEQTYFDHFKQRVLNKYQKSLF